MKLNTRKGNPHLINSLAQFKLFIKKDFIAPIDITENFCKRFLQFLLDKYTRETSDNYYLRFKWAVSAAEVTSMVFSKERFRKGTLKIKPQQQIEGEPGGK